jgi:hypothetical protein
MMFQSKQKQDRVPAYESTVVLGTGLAISGFFVPGREYRYGAAHVSILLGHGKNYFNRFLSRGTKTPAKALEELRKRGFTGYVIPVKAPRLQGGATLADTIGVDDFSIWVEYEACVRENPKAIALLTSSFREILLDRTQKAFNLPELSQEEKVEQFGLSFSERESLWDEDQADLNALLLPGDENGYDLFPEDFLLAVKYDSLLADYGVASIRC